MPGRPSTWPLCSCRQRSRVFTLKLTKSWCSAWWPHPLQCYGHFCELSFIHFHFYHDQTDPLITGGPAGGGVLPHSCPQSICCNLWEQRFQCIGRVKCRFFCPLCLPWAMADTMFQV